MKQGIFQSTVSTENNDYEILIGDMKKKGNWISMKDIHISDFVIIVMKEYIQRYGKKGVNRGIREATQIPIINLLTNKFDVVSNLSFILGENHDSDHFFIDKTSLSTLLDLIVDLSVDR